VQSCDSYCWRCDRTSDIHRINCKKQCCLERSTYIQLCKPKGLTFQVDLHFERFFLSLITYCLPVQLASTIIYSLIFIYCRNKLQLLQPERHCKECESYPNKYILKIHGSFMSKWVLLVSLLLNIFY
jgi:hypothetical protein